jgi:hypothetical protein
MSKRPPIRTTGFTRFFIVMLFVAPLAYIGASYYNGEDGIQNIKKLLRLDKATTAASTPTEVPAKEAETVRVNEAPSNQALQAENLRIKEELEFKKKRIDELYRENEELKRKLESAEKVLEESKK